MWVQIVGPNCSCGHGPQLFYFVFFWNLPTDDTERAFKLGEDGLISTAEAEETLVEEIEGVVIDTTSVREQDLGRGKRKKFRNKHYF